MIALISFNRFLRRTRKSVVYYDKSFLWFFLAIVLLSLIKYGLSRPFISTIYIIIVFFFTFFFHDALQIFYLSLKGYKIKRYVLFPFGSKKTFNKEILDSRESLFYGLVGFIANIILMAVTLLIAYFFPTTWPKIVSLKTTITAQTFDSYFVNYPVFIIFWINLLFFSFNLLLPALPLDGGFILYTILKYIFGSFSAKKIMRTVSKVIGIILALLGLVFWDLLVLLIGVFIYYISNKFISEQELFSTLYDKIAKDYISKKYLLVNADETLFDVFAKMAEKKEADVVVKYGKESFGVISVDKFANISKSYWASMPIGDYAKKIDYVLPNESLAFVVQYMLENSLKILPVYDKKEKKLIGVLKRADLANIIRISSLNV